MATSLRRFVWNGGQLAGELDSAGALQVMYAYGPSGLAPVVYRDWVAGTNHALHPDERGSVVARSGPTGQVAAVTTYDDYGRSGGSAPTRFGFTGHVTLAEAGLVHMRASAGVIYIADDRTNFASLTGPRV